ncbi:MAG: bifunctional proline dehydrogenase/L-glutamate gamma-semialdehyde dehydrogenase PutA, partial [Cellvibrionaceae bacterium]|nr:bifunctional proline dehydrogenase/L-glutamate gamma-semialdehyde dehydrogenase PutA [Cellvibrionaceae bacterium]
KAHNIGFTVDAEEADRLELSMAVIEAVYLDARLDGWQGFGLAVQAYQKRAPLIIDWLAELAERGGRKIMVRLVKGAYWDSEIKWSQEAGLADYPVFTRKASTDVCYQICAQKLLDARAQLFPQFATHNAYTVATILELDKERSGYEFQRLHGMGEALYENLVKDTGLSCRIYAPVGEHADLLAYLVRRLLENGANSSFVNNIVDESVPVESLLQDPCLSVAVWDDVRNSVIPLPKDIYRAEFAAGSIQPRANAKGLELSDADECEALKQSLASLWQLYCEQCNEKHSYRVSNPALRSETVGGYDMDNPQSIEAKLTAAVEVQPQWQAAGVNARAEVLEQLAEALEQQRDELILLCVKEAGKTLADAVAEIREAVDFCRYYARQAQLVDAGQARGVVLCISPWNFPLAIFLGQVAAALVCGNTVLAKPAEQTSLIALRCLALLQKICTERGLPAALLQLLLGPGKAIGEQLVPDPRIAAVMFTGSTATGQWINRCLAGRADNNIPLIAETGGQNAMIVDSTALPEQVVDDVLSSGFQSAGQRCSALRVLFLQEDVADKIIAMIKGAMAQLNIGDPAFLRTDVGPVIDSAALERLNAHRQRLAQLPDRQARLLYRCELAEQHQQAGTFFAPELYEIASLDLLSEEVFGPVVHVVRYKAGQMDQLLAQIGSSGFGLTLGVHSRIQAVSERIAERAPVGNVYINRNIIGAIVGVQPFGGHGLSGTGPKAGGPDYLTALLADGSADQPQVDTELPELAPAQGLNLAPASPDWQALPYEQRRAAAQDFLAKLAALSQSPQLSTAMAAAEASLERMETLLAQPSLLPG